MQTADNQEFASVYYAYWEMECCGTPFEIGSEVEFPIELVKDEPLQTLMQRFCPEGDTYYYYAAHDQDYLSDENDTISPIPNLIGTVTDIKLHLEEIKAQNVGDLPWVTGKEKLINIEVANEDSGENLIDEDENMEATAFIVRLANIRFKDKE